jgi:secondary thiamine-phosphate synthase enzyme
MKCAHHTIEVSTQGRGLYLITHAVEEWFARQQVRAGLLTVMIQHTSASLLVQENADPSVRTDLERFFARLVKDGDPSYTHTDEGPDDMPSHIRAALTQTSLSIPIISGRLALGTWQGIYVYEHRHAPHRRRVVLQVLGAE